MPMDYEALNQIQLNFSPATQQLLQIVLGIIMFGVALELRTADFRRLASDPKTPIIGLVCQFVLLPAIAFALVSALNTPAPIALGVILVAACPGGNLSNYLTTLANGNGAVSVTMSSISTMLSIIMTPLNLTFWASLNPETAALMQSISVDPVEIMTTVVTILIIPTLLGMGCNHWLPTLARRISTPLKFASMLIFLLFVVGALSGNLGALAEYWPLIVLPMVLLNAIGLLLGYTAARLLHLPTRDCRAVMFETGIQNSGFGLILAIRFFRPAGVGGGMELMCAGWGIWHIVTGLGIAFFCAIKDRRIAAKAEAKSGN